MPGSSTNTTPIDLSRLPRPRFIEPTSFETILARITARMLVLQPEFDATDEADPAVAVLQAAAWFAMMKEQETNDVAIGLLLAYAEKAELDQIGANYNVERLLLDAGAPLTGTDPVYESDDDFRRRIQLSPEALSVAGPATAYEFHALSADPSIAGARATSPEPDDIRELVLSVLSDHDAGDELVTAMTSALDDAVWPGTVLLSILSRDGDGSADADQIEAVDGVLGNATQALRPLTDHVVIQSAEIIPYTIDIELTLFDGPDETPVIAAAQAGVERYKIECRRMGRNVNRAGLFAASRVEGVSNVRINSPAADVEVDDTQCAHCVGTSVTVAGRGE